MVEQFGMALTIDEINSLHWEEIINIEKFVKQLYACIIKMEIFPSGMCHTIPHKGQKIRAITFIIVTTFTWHYKKIHNML
jgi:hypothetical protein